MQTLSPVSKNKITIQMLGAFKITVGETIITNTERNSQMWNLLQYLVCARHRTILQEELIKNLWSSSANGTPGALKNLVWRVRQAFEEAGVPFYKDIILFRRGCYSFNNSLDITVDTELFSEYFALTQQTDLTVGQRISACQKAVDLYQGNFATTSKYCAWAQPFIQQYQALFFKCAYTLLKMYEAQSNYEQMYQLAQKSVKIDRFAEPAHKYLLISLIRQNKQQQALQHYRHLSTLFYEERGQRLNQTMRNLYREIAKSVNSVQIDLNVIKEDLEEQEKTQGAFVCEYEVFKDIYRLMARSASRTGESVLIGLLTLTTAEGELPPQKQINRAMENLINAVTTNLRKGDVVARYSPAQYVIMLPRATYKNGQPILQRIEKAFSYSSLKLQTNLQPLDPLE
ncbi:MAG: BTAD domain-containing putative transcriptional regulator [Oscillospiraceae bacterium]|nr:BTAD domain-containing putative transcriptional regulator [Oscillospiraceae bacterium]